jgi:preprotein translocase subunit YajC
MIPQLVQAQMAGGEGPSPFGPILIMGLIFGFFYFLVMRPQQKKESEKEAFRAALKKNDEVSTLGGLLGKVIEVKGPVVFLEIGQNVRVRVERRAIEPPVGAPAAKTEKSDDKTENAR